MAELEIARYVAEIKRSGFAVLEEQAQRNSQPPGTVGLDMLLSPEPTDAGLDDAAMRSRLAGLHEGWGER